MRLWRGLFIGLLALVMMPGARVAPAQADRAAEVIADVNAYRVALGLAPLEIHPSLMVAAQMHVEWMVRTGNFGHIGEGGSTPPQRAAAAGYPTAGWYVYENWVGGTGMTPAEAVAWWDQSPIHQATMRVDGFEHIGAGYASDGGQNYYVLLVAKPSVATASSAGGTAGSASESGGAGDNYGDEYADEYGTPTPVAVVMVPVVRSAPGPDGSIVHVVQQGQTAWTIAAVYGIDLMDLVNLNHLGPRAMVKPGDHLIIKLGEGQPVPTAPASHTVQEGETAWTIAALYGLTLDDLLQLNHIDRSTVLYPGDEVLIRDPEPTATPTDIPTATPTAAIRPTRSDITLAPTRTSSPTWTASPDVPMVTPSPTVTPLPAAPAAPAEPRHTSDRALVASLAVGGAGLLFLASGALIARRRGRR
jgi:LysM repeat protein